MESESVGVSRRVPWNKAKLTGQKPPSKLRGIWAIRTRLQLTSNARELAMFNLAIDSKLRACDLTRLQRCRTSVTAATLPPGQQSCSKRPSGPSSSRLRSRLAKALKRGSKHEDSRLRIFCLQAGWIRHRIFRRGNKRHPDVEIRVHVGMRATAEARSSVTATVD